MFEGELESGNYEANQGGARVTIRKRKSTESRVGKRKEENLKRKNKKSCNCGSREPRSGWPGNYEGRKGGLSSAGMSP